MNKRDIRRTAKFCAGLILQSALANGWHPDDLVKDHGDAVVDAIAEEISEIAHKLIEGS